MRYGALVGWGIVIYAVMFLLWSGLVTYGFVDGLAPRILGLLVLIGLSLTAGYSLRAHSWLDVLPYSICWAIVMALFDGVFSFPLAGWQLYLDPNVWFGYAVVAITPLFSPSLHLRRSSSSTLYTP